MIFAEPKLPRLRSLLTAAVAANERMEAEARARQVARSECDCLLGQLRAVAAAMNWSGRRLAQRAGITDSSLRNLAAGRTEPARWLPDLRAASARLANTITRAAA